MSTPPSYPPEPAKTCAHCPRLVRYRHEYAAKEPDWFNGAVPSFGDEQAELLIIGLAPGLRGANRTGRTFTGDPSGALLYETLTRFKFTSGTYAEHGQDDLRLNNVMITNAVRCVPPQNKPTGAEINACRPYLKARIAALPNVKTLLMLGKVAHDSTLRTLGLKLKDHPFGHGVQYSTHDEGRPLTLLSSYHCSRYNVNTRRLTPDMFDQIFITARASL